MSEPTLRGHSSQRVTWVLIAVGLVLLTLTIVVLQNETVVLYAGVAIGVGMVFGSGVVNYVAVKSTGANGGEGGDERTGDVGN